MSGQQHLGELGMVVAAMIVPQLILASEVNGDEFAKATSGIALAGLILGAYRVWKGWRPKDG